VDEEQSLASGVFYKIGPVFHPSGHPVDVKLFSRKVCAYFFAGRKKVSHLAGMPIEKPQGCGKRQRMPSLFRKMHALRDADKRSACIIDSTR
jgi:hypothetical protein